MVHDTIRARVVETYEANKAEVIQVLARARSKVHVAFDGWRSGNRLSLYGIVVFFLDENDSLRKLVLDIPDIRDNYTGENIATRVDNVLRAFGIEKKIEYFTLDNASNNDTAVQELGKQLGFDGMSRRVRCFGHIVNLAAGALLFGKDPLAFENILGSDPANATLQHEQWQRQGPIGKLATIVVAIHRSNLIMKHLMDNQEHISRAQKPLGLVIYVPTRWLSMLYAIRRALQLRPFIQEIWVEQHFYWRRRKDPPTAFRTHMELSDDDWQMITATGEVLEDLEDALRTLEGDGIARQRSTGFTEAYGSMWDYTIGFEWLLERLELWKTLASSFPQPEHFSVNINLAWDKLQTYYLKLDDTPVYYGAIALHPAYRWEFFTTYWDQQSWIDRAKKIVQDLWDTEYKGITIEVIQQQPSLKRRKAFEDKFGRKREAWCSRHEPSPSSLSLSASQSPTPELQGPPALDEYARWQDSIDITDNEVVDPFAYWHERRGIYPRLSQMALDLLSVPAMSAEVERLFSAAGRMVTAERSRLDANTISIFQSLRSWHIQGIAVLSPEHPALFPAPITETFQAGQEQEHRSLSECGFGLPVELVIRNGDGRVVGPAGDIESD